MKKIIIVMAVLAFSALAFGDETPTTGATGTTPTTEAGKTDTKTDAMAGKKMAKKSKHTHKAKKAATTGDKAM